MPRQILKIAEIAADVNVDGIESSENIEDILGFLNAGYKRIGVTSLTNIVDL